MPNLTGVSITFSTLDDDKDFNTVVHVFVKNRLNTTEGSDTNNTFISNFLASQRYLTPGRPRRPRERPVPGLRHRPGRRPGFGDPSTNTFDLTLMPEPVSLDDIVLPPVRHPHPAERQRPLAVRLQGHVQLRRRTASPFSSKDDGGLPGVILDQNNKNYSGICAENSRPLPAPARPATKSALRSVTLDFVTHNDNKDFDTQLDVEIVNRLSATSATGIAVGNNLFPGEEFVDGGPVHTSGGRPTTAT